MNELTRDSRDRLVADLKTVLSDAEELLRLTAADASGKLGDVRERMGEHVDAARARLSDAEAIVRERTREAAKATDVYVRENPWQSIGIAAGAAFLLGLLAGRR